MVAWVLAVLVASGGAVGLYFSVGLHGDDRSIEMVRSNDAISLTYREGLYALEPVDGNPTVGLVFYPGGRVHPDAYVASLAPLVARADVAVYVPEMPLNLAVVDADRADEIISRHPEIDRWIVGGHSLGGAMACRYADQATERIVGVLLFAAYCDVDIGARSLAVLSVTGSADAVVNREAYRRNRANLPANATVVEIAGMNHSQFGSYTGQRGDRPARITDDRAHRRLADVVVPWIENRTTRGERRETGNRDRARPEANVSVEREEVFDPETTRPRR